MSSAVEVQRAFVQAALVDRAALAGFQEANDVLQAAQTLKKAFRTDVSPILAMARLRSGGAIDPVAAYRASGYREQGGRQASAEGRRFRLRHRLMTRACHVHSAGLFSLCLCARGDGCTLNTRASCRPPSTRYAALQGAASCCAWAPAASTRHLPDRRALPEERHDAAPGPRRHAAGLARPGRLPAAAHPRGRHRDALAGGARQHLRRAGRGPCRRRLHRRRRQGLLGQLLGPARHLRAARPALGVGLRLPAAPPRAGLRVRARHHRRAACCCAARASGRCTSATART